MDLSSREELGKPGPYELLWDHRVPRVETGTFVEILELPPRGVKEPSRLKIGRGISLETPQQKGLIS